jgi:hypothetical protein
MCNFYGADELVIGRVYYHHWLNENRGYPVTLVDIKEDKDEILVIDGWGYEWPSRVKFLRPAVHYYDGWKPLA